MGVRFTTDHTLAVKMTKTKIETFRTTKWSSNEHQTLTHKARGFDPWHLHSYFLYSQICSFARTTLR